jgi:hypothetical protein
MDKTEREGISKELAETIIEKNLDEERLKRIIINTSIVAWKQKISSAKIESWLENFDGKYFKDVKNERRLALWMLAHFTYYTYEDVRILCKNLFNQYIHMKLDPNESGNLEQNIMDIIKNTLFIGLGNDSESGNNILYYFRQENKLSKENFEIDLKREYKNLVYIDDVTISGSQAHEYTQLGNIKAKNVYAAVLLATDQAIDYLTSPNVNIPTISTVILDKRDKAFSDESYVFSENNIIQIKPIAKEFCLKYGERAVQDCGYMVHHPLGFANGQYLIGFEYNTPDNTLPIFWGTGGGWKPLFERYPKICSGKEYILDGRKYY